jgi:predicted nucleic acid-binding protein
MSNKYNSSNIQSITNKKIFLDANILIYLFGFGTPTFANWENQYATLYTKLNNQNNTFVVDYIVISEFINRAIKIEYNNYLISNNLNKNRLTYKDYRNSLDGQEAISDIYITLNDEILYEFEVIEKSYSKDDLKIMCCIDELDFSDKAIVKICEDNQFILLTNDTDFKNSNIDIISCHKKMCFISGK